MSSPLDTLNASYSTPTTFTLPTGTTLVSFDITPISDSIGTTFGFWYSTLPPNLDINKRIFGTPLNGAMFVGIRSNVPQDTFTITTPNNGYPFTIANYRAGNESAVSETPEPDTLAMLGSGLIAMGAATRRRFNFFQLKRKLNAFRGPKREHTEAMRRVLDAMGEQERKVLTQYYLDNKTVEQIAAEFGCSAEWIRAMEADPRSRFAGQIKTPCQGSLGDLIASA